MTVPENDDPVVEPVEASAEDVPRPGDALSVVEPVEPPFVDEVFGG